MLAYLQYFIQLEQPMANESKGMLMGLCVTGMVLKAPKARITYKVQLMNGVFYKYLSSWNQQMWCLLIELLLHVQKRTSSCTEAVTCMTA